MKKTLIILTCLLCLCSTNTLANEKKDNITLQQKRLEYLNLDFWENFQDENLVNNLTTVYKNNNDLKAVNYKVSEAQRLVKISFANELPHIGFDGYVGQVFKSSDQVFGDITIPDYTEAHFLLPLTLNYEIDIWGKNHLRTKAQKKKLGMVEQDERTTYILLTSAFASDYFNLIKADKLIQLQNELIKSQEEVLNAVKIKYQLGTMTLDTVIAEEKVLTYMKEDLQSLLEKQDTLKNQLSVLLSDSSFKEISRTNYENLAQNPNIPTSIDVSLLENRPDRIKSELELEKIGYDVKVAKRDLLPKFVLTGDLGFNLYSLSSSHKFLADIGIAPTWDLFMGGKKIQALKLQKDAYKIAEEHYEKTILQSMQETNDALYLVKSTLAKKNIANERLMTDNKQYDFTKTKAHYGTADELDVLIKKQEQLVSQKHLVSYNINELLSAIGLYQALGGINYFDNNSKNL